MSKTIRVRMYNVGFGDCFLLALPDKRTMLVDAGFHSQGKGAFGGNDLVDQIVEDVKAISGEARIDVVIATHRHQDHVYAFNSDKWDDVEVGEVWLPWVEDRANKQATGLWKKQKRFALQLAAAVPTFNLSEVERQDVEFMLWNAGVDLPGFAGVGGWSNAGALDCLHEGFVRRDRDPTSVPSGRSKRFRSRSRAPRCPVCASTSWVRRAIRTSSRSSTPRPTARRIVPSRYARLTGGAMNGGPAGAAPFGGAWQVPDDRGRIPARGR